MLMPGTTGLGDPAFDLIAWRSSWPGTHLLLGLITTLRALPRSARLLEAIGLLRCVRATRIEIADQSAFASHADAEDLGGASITLSFPGLTLPLLVPRKP